MLITKASCFCLLKWDLQPEWPGSIKNWESTGRTKLTKSRRSTSKKVTFFDNLTLVLNAFYSKKRASVVSADAASPEGAVTTMLDMVNRDFKMDEIFAKCKELSKVRKFDESFEVIVKLNVDPT